MLILMGANPDHLEEAYCKLCISAKNARDIARRQHGAFAEEEAAAKKEEEDGEGDDQLWLSGRGAIAGCHCRVPL